MKRIITSIFAILFLVPIVSLAQESGTLPPPPPTGTTNTTSTMPPPEGGQMPPPQYGQYGMPPEGMQGGTMQPPSGYGQQQYGQSPQQGFAPMGSSTYGRPGMGPGPNMGPQGDYGPRPGPQGNYGDRKMDQRMQGGGEFGEGGMSAVQAKQMIRGMERPVANFKKMLERLKKQNIAVPAGAEALVTELSNAIATVKASTGDSEELDAALEVLQDKGQELGEIGRTLGMLEQLPRVIKEAEKQIKQVRKQLTRAQTAATKNKTDISGITGKIESSIQEIEKAIAAAKFASASSTDLEDVMDSIRDTVFEPLQDLRDEVMVLEQLSNASRMMKMAEKEIARVEKLAAQLKKQKKDTAELEQLIADMKQKLADVKSLLADKDVDKEELFDAFSEAERLHNDVAEELAELQGRPSDVDKEFNKAQQSVTQNLSSTVINAFQSLRDLLPW